MNKSLTHIAHEKNNPDKIKKHVDFSISVIPLYRYINPKEMNTENRASFTPMKKVFCIKPVWIINRMLINVNFLFNAKVLIKNLDQTIKIIICIKII